ncbi:MAG: tRNA (guanine(10)-N(2))-dimethyltransferase [Candidatus Freyarchaeota archaeon]|nr:tRNA (guanine(10)-N(2))-dimethyltransferase [Candidatus Jordarchaeia archaeon]MBS7270019.1 tRNA (guanine(10)-N(2))-dimethyltransferase [Candidatus Jordarchaeia archaeon]MBS7280825.1 tRNA (guanine(10)-N(2))-dimethyltransferase [Candidatus Jordarchaeia archaeon]
MENYRITIYHEGKVDFYTYSPPIEKFRAGRPLPKAPVFYNPSMKLNRDIAVYAVRTHQQSTGRNLKICEPLTGCGIRGIRFALEVEGVDEVVINDLSPDAFNVAKRNVEMHNLQSKIQVFNKDANLFLAENAAYGKRFDVIDIDPFGSPVPFLDSALSAIRKNEGLLCLTATDMAPLCGIHRDACLRKYGGVPLRTMYCHEVAVRLLISCAVLTAAKREIALIPLLSHSTDHYVRTYLKTSSGVENTNESVEQVGYLIHCPSCHFRQLKPGIASTLSGTCPLCGRGILIGGPLWCGKIQSREFVSQILENAKKDGDKKSIKLLSTILEESDAPATYYDLHYICDQLNLPCPRLDKVMIRLRERGYLVTRTHFKNNALKTNAPISEILRAIREAQ